MLLIFLVVAAALVALARGACPEGGETRYGSHVIPKHVYYTGKTDDNLRNLTGERGSWPTEYQFHFFDNDDLDSSMRELDAVIPGVYEAFGLLRPWAFKADLWRYCVLYACGGVYVDSKLSLNEPFDEFLWKLGFRPGIRDGPQLFSCRDDLASESARGRLDCVWQGLLISEPKNPTLLKAIQFVVAKVRDRWYPTPDLSFMPWLFLTGPGAIALANQRDWRDHLTLGCRMMYTKKDARGLQDPHLVGDWHPLNHSSVFNDDLARASFVADPNLHESQRTNNYGRLFKSHLVYADDVL
ncbi:hypothetical protein CTAYLR_003815 [Chrysophaeum taylorii]|uniref:Uncharacterized protein n=1 Tax=Chrysophaeum taylorii TaxID=2483200 RepID=A0AAD7XKQ5_9STRA|nr:hypothetical protein CTAYLR_003815 [Chrysophaeum taylorii]